MQSNYEDDNKENNKNKNNAHDVKSMEQLQHPIIFNENKNHVQDEEEQVTLKNNMQVEQTLLSELTMQNQISQEKLTNKMNYIKSIKERESELHEYVQENKTNMKMI